MTWIVRNWIPGSNPRDLFEVEEHERQATAVAEYEARAETIRQIGGACEMVSPDGTIAASIMRPLGGGR